MKPGISHCAAGLVLGALAAFAALGGRISNAFAAVKAADAKALEALLGCPVITPEGANKYRIARDIANTPSPKAMVLWEPQHDAPARPQPHRHSVLPPRESVQRIHPDALVRPQGRPQEHRMGAQAVGGT
ncbi:hypothetical protein LJR175_007921 [Variovorax sp. LjRoot175]|uniref:hypothetical protein n=1 Tax=Variovorax sp. LjRoot175 TaxID=3342276 RepID=UPI003ECEB2B5